MGERLTTKSEQSPGLTSEQAGNEQLEGLLKSGGEHRQLEHPDLQGEANNRRRQELSLNDARKETEQAYEQQPANGEQESNRAETAIETESVSAERSDQPRPKQEHAKQPQNSKEVQEERFDKTMSTVQAQMSTPSRTFSKVIHSPTIEKASEVAGNTVARPNAILSGAVVAFLFTLGVYVIARSNGYPLSGAESIAAFALGWLCGLAFDFVRMMILGRRDV